MSASIEEEINEIKSLRDEGRSVIPEIDFNSLGKEGFNDEQKSTIKKRGCVIIRNTFDRSLAQEWNSELGGYLKNVGYYENPDKGLDKYFSSLQKGEYQHPQIFSVYWSPPQVQARQHSRTTTGSVGARLHRSRPGAAPREATDR